MLFGELVERNNGVVNMMSLAQAPGIITAVNNLAAATFFLLSPFKAGKIDAMRKRIVFRTLVATTLLCARLSYGQEDSVRPRPLR